MGRNTKNFRQSSKSRSGDQGARNFAQVQRIPWHGKILNWIKVRGKNNG